MKRHDYRQSAFARLSGDTTAWIAARRIRAPLALAAAALLFLTAIWLTETQRLAMLDNELAAIRIDAAHAEVHAERVRVSAEVLERERAVQARIAVARRSAVASSNAIATLGNALPVQTWLTDVTTAPTGSWTISGRSGLLTEIGRTLRAIQRLDPHGSARLVSITATGRSDTIHDFVIGWDRAQ